MSCFCKMSVLGIDVGNSTSVVGLARRNGIDVVLNSESKRETPSMVNFSSKQVRAATSVLQLRCASAWRAERLRKVLLLLSPSPLCASCSASSACPLARR